MTATVACCSRWAKYEELVRVLQSNVRYIQFSVKAQRDATRTALLGLLQPAPFAREWRYENAIFLNMGNTNIARLFSQLMNAVNVIH